MDEYITIALPKGKLFDKSVRLLAKVGYGAENVTEDFSTQAGNQQRGNQGTLYYCQNR